MEAVEIFVARAVPFWVLPWEDSAVDSVHRAVDLVVDSADSEAVTSAAVDPEEVGNERQEP